MASAKQSAGGKYIVGIAGGPGSGKSTLATAVCNRCNQLHGVPGRPLAVVVPMDGFHLYKRELDTMPDPVVGVWLGVRPAAAAVGAARALQPSAHSVSTSTSSPQQRHPAHPSWSQEAHARRGAHWTFDAPAFVACISAIRQQGAASVPSFDHAVGDPVPDDIQVGLVVGPAAI